MRYAIVNNGFPVHASPSAVLAHIGGGISINTVKLWSEEKLNSFGVYTIMPVKEPLLSYQTHDSGTLSFVGGKVLNTFAAIDMDVDSAKQETLDKLAQKRYNIETGGVVVNGVSIETDRDTQSKLIATRIIAKEDPAYVVNWKANGTFMTLDAATIIAVADAVRAHVQAAFDKEMTLAAQINAATTLDELRAIDIEAGW